MKKLILLLLITLLSSCASEKVSFEKVDEIFKNTGNYVELGFNNYTKYIDYYQPSDLFENESDFLSYSFKYNNSSIVMNVNIAGVIADELYDGNLFNEGFFDKNTLVYSKSGEYLNVDGNNVPFKYYIYDYKDKYLLYFYSQDLIIYSYCNVADVENISMKILYLAKDSSIDKEAILADFSNKDIIDYHRKQVDLFETTLPVNGRVDELMVDN